MRATPKGYGEQDGAEGDRVLPSQDIIPALDCLCPGCYRKENFVLFKPWQIVSPLCYVTCIYDAPFPSTQLSVLLYETEFGALPPSPPFGMCLQTSLPVLSPWHRLEQPGGEAKQSRRCHARLSALASQHRLVSQDVTTSEGDLHTLGARLAGGL